MFAADLSFNDAHKAVMSLSRSAVLLPSMFARSCAQLTAALQTQCFEPGPMSPGSATPLSPPAFFG